MTTVVAKDGILAADSQLTWGGYVLRVQKLFRLPDGGVASGCGEWCRTYAGLQWLADGEQGEPPNIKGADLVVIRPNGVIWLACGQFPMYPLLDKQVAIGAGSDLARMALADGMDAVAAVKRASELDLGSSGPVQSMAVVSVPELPEAVTHVSKRRR